ncbi:MAG: cbb3-type cytochrome oxidase assembly protein CcoS [Polaromonas sp.]|nr:cbb3-type cytochrome oxidase assembly protein CcoS [Polaromonas sp.]
MDILFLLVPLSVILALAIMAVLAWAVWSGQFEDIDNEGRRIFGGGEGGAPRDADPQGPAGDPPPS